jgi:heptosyltransferase-2
LDNAVRRSTQIPFDGVPSEPEIFLRRTSRWSIAKKYLHKVAKLRLAAQPRLEQSRLERSQRILWIYARRNFGDATMDMSGRALLKGLSYRLDLLTLPALRPLFAEDDVFGKVYSSVEEVDASQYDAILLSEFNLQSIRLKTRHFRRMPFACLFQFFYGPDRNQTCFSFATVNQVFGLGHSVSELQRLSKPYLSASAATRDSVAPLLPAEPYLALGAGGIDANRTWHRWAELVALLERCDDPRIPHTLVLLGSDNGLDTARELCALPTKRVRITSLVGQLAFLQAREVVAHAALFVGADGGLMHVAHTTNTPSVSLFSDREPPPLRLTDACHSIGLQENGDVDTIAPQTVMDAIVRQLTGAAGTPATSEAARAD